MSNVTEISYGNYTENDCYFFTYDHVNIDFLSILFNRTRESIIYQNGRLVDMLVFFVMKIFVLFTNLMILMYMVLL